MIKTMNMIVENMNVNVSVYYDGDDDGLKSMNDDDDVDVCDDDDLNCFQIIFGRYRIEA